MPWQLSQFFAGIAFAEASPSGAIPYELAPVARSVQEPLSSPARGGAGQSRVGVPHFLCRVCRGTGVNEQDPFSGMFEMCEPCEGEGIVPTTH
jgi:hypothetical protein